MSPWWLLPAFWAGASLGTFGGYSLGQTFAKRREEREFQDRPILYLDHPCPTCSEYFLYPRGDSIICDACGHALPALNPLPPDAPLN